MWPVFTSSAVGGLTTLYQLAVRHSLVLVKELACTVLVSLGLSGFPAWQEVYALTPGPLRSWSWVAELLIHFSFPHPQNIAAEAPGAP